MREQPSSAAVAFWITSVHSSISSYDCACSTTVSRGEITCAWWEEEGVSRLRESVARRYARCLKDEWRGKLTRLHTRQERQMRQAALIQGSG